MNNDKQRNGIAIWWELEKEMPNPEVHLDINVWNTIKTDDIDYVEFGIKIEKHTNLKELYIYLLSLSAS